MISSHFDCIEKIIRNDPLVIYVNLHRNFTSLNTAYIKGEITFADGSSLAVFQHVRIQESELFITDYRYHCMTHDRQLIFRYDNAPHHSEITTFPHHKHLPLDVQSADMPDIEDVLAETDSLVIKNSVII
ncbi:MAG: DUF6516 family protein [Desulfococcaceae bacterium]